MQSRPSRSSISRSIRSKDRPRPRSRCAAPLAQNNGIRGQNLGKLGLERRLITPMHRTAATLHQTGADSGNTPPEKAPSVTPVRSSQRSRAEPWRGSRKSAVGGRQDVTTGPARRPHPASHPVQTAIPPTSAPACGSQPPIASETRSARKSHWPRARVQWLRSGKPLESRKHQESNRQGRASGGFSHRATSPPKWEDRRHAATATHHRRAVAAKPL